MGEELGEGHFFLLFSQLSQQIMGFRIFYFQLKKHANDCTTGTPSDSKKSKMQPKKKEKPKKSERQESCHGQGKSFKSKEFLH